LKKFLFLFLIVWIAAGAIAPQAAAQFTWRLDADFNTRLASWLIPTGERAEKTISVGDVTRYNNTTYNPTAGRGNYTYTSGAMDLFNFSRLAAIRGNALYLYLDYRSEAVALHTAANLSNMVSATATANTGTGQNELAGGHSFTMGSGRTPNWGDFLRYSFEEWYIRANFLFLTAYVGNTSNLGRVTNFNNFSDDVLRAVRVERYGVNTPTNNAADFAAQEVNNFTRSPTVVQGGVFSYNTIPYFMVGARFDKLSFPLTFQIAADPGNNNMSAASFNYRKISGMFRVSGEKIANRITFDAIYKLRGGDPNDLDNYDPDGNPGGTLQPNGDGIFSHVFGLYANILAVPNFGFGLGYSGYLKVFEATLDKTTGEATTKSGPLFSGIDLRLVYTGIKNTTITSHNNVSFANAGTSSADAVSIGVWGQNLLPDYAQSWFALYNALGVNYRINSQLSASFQIANRLGIVTTTVTPSASDAYEYKRSYVKFAGGGYCRFQFNRYLLLQGGIAFFWEHNSYSNTNPGAQAVAATRDAAGGTFDISIPIRMRISFRP